MGQHSIAELFAALTRLPVQPRIHPIEAARIVTDNMLPHFEIVSIGTEDYLEALNTMASGGWTGAKIYDALLLRCAARCTAERIYTFISGISGSWLRRVYVRRFAHHDEASSVFDLAVRGHASSALDGQALSPGAFFRRVNTARPAGDRQGRARCRARNCVMTFLVKQGDQCGLPFNIRLTRSGSRAIRVRQARAGWSG